MPWPKSLQGLKAMKIQYEFKKVKSLLFQYKNTVTSSNV